MRKGRNMGKEEENRRRWEDLGADCLVNIFQKLGVKDLVTGVPLVCKSWREATLNPRSWEVLNMGAADAFPGILHFSSLFSFLILRSQRVSRKVIFPEDDVPVEDAVYLLERCPALETLALPRLQFGCDERAVYNRLAARWQNLRYLYMRYKPIYLFQEILGDISPNLNSLVGLQVYGVVEDEDAVAIVALLPKLRFLCLSGSIIYKSTLLRVMNGCGDLEEVLVEKCPLLHVDEEVLGCASRLKVFKYDDSRPATSSGSLSYGQALPSSPYDSNYGESNFVCCGSNDEVRFRVRSNRIDFDNEDYYPHYTDSDDCLDNEVYYPHCTDYSDSEYGQGLNDYPYHTDSDDGQDLNEIYYPSYTDSAEGLDLNDEVYNPRSTDSDDCLDNEVYYPHCTGSDSDCGRGLNDYPYHTDSDHGHDLSEIYYPDYTDSGDGLDLNEVYYPHYTYSDDCLDNEVYYPHCTGYSGSDYDLGLDDYPYDAYFDDGQDLNEIYYPYYTDSDDLWSGP